MISLTKKAAQVRIEPYEKIIEDAIAVAELVMGSGYFAGIKEIVVEQGGPDHYGLTKSDESDKIYIAANRIKSEFSSDRFEQVLHAAETLVHEMGHIKSNFTGGESPAEAAEKDFLNKAKDLINKKPGDFEKYRKASLRKQPAIRFIVRRAAVEVTEVHDGLTGKPVAVTTTARIAFRKMNPAWAKIKNDILSEQIAKQFAATKEMGRFVPKKAPTAVGYIRGTESAKFIAVETESAVVVVAAKGAHRLGAVAGGRPTGKISKGSRDSDLRSHRGWLENHFFDIFIGQYAFDSNTENILREYAFKNGVKKMRGMSKADINQLAVTLMGEDQRGQITRDPGYASDNLGMLTTPVGFPI